MLVFFLSAILLGLGVAGIAIKIWAKEGGEFAGTCASNNPYLNEEGEPCSFCGAKPDEKCKSDSMGSNNGSEEFSPFVA